MSANSSNLATLPFLDPRTATALDANPGQSGIVATYTFNANPTGSEMHRCAYDVTIGKVGGSTAFVAGAVVHQLGPDEWTTEYAAAANQYLPKGIALCAGAVGKYVPIQVSGMNAVAIPTSGAVAAKAMVHKDANATVASSGSDAVRLTAIGTATIAAAGNSLIAGSLLVNGRHA